MQHMKKLADHAINGAEALPFRNLGVRLHGGEAIITLAVGGAQTAQNSRHKQGEAADRRIGGQSDPKRKRERHHRHNCNHPSCRRQKYQTYKHFVQLPRDVPTKFARATWQDCDPLWVNLRRRNRRTGSGKTEMPREIHTPDPREGQYPKEDASATIMRFPAKAVSGRIKIDMDLLIVSCTARGGVMPRISDGDPEKSGCAKTVGDKIVRTYYQATEFVRYAILLSCRGSKVPRS
jgi:hypothetical protein